MASKKNTPKRLNLTQMADMLGIAKPVLLEQERRGAFERGPDRKFDVAEVLAYRAAMDPRFVAGGDVARAKAGKAPQIAPDAAVQPGADADANMSLPEAKRREARWKAERAELIYKKEAGELISREEVESSIEVIATTVQMRIKNLAPKLRPHMSDAGRTILDKELDAVLREMGSDIQKMVEKNGD